MGLIEEAPSRPKNHRRLDLPERTGINIRTIERMIQRCTFPPPTRMAGLVPLW
jgi:hypothetical protein